MDDAHDDAFGQALWHWVTGERDLEVYERPDGYVEAGPGPEVYLAEFRAWTAAERAAAAYVRGAVVDVGCGAGRVALDLERRGQRVVSVDASAMAVRAARRMGAGDARVMNAESLTRAIGSFDTIVLFGNNFGIFGDPGRVHEVLRRWAERTGPGTRILAESTSPASGGVPTLDAAWRAHNRAERRWPGHTQLRIRYRRWATPWFWWLFVSPTEMRRLLAGTGWIQRHVLCGAPGEPYVAVLEKP